MQAKLNQIFFLLFCLFAFTLSAQNDVLINRKWLNRENGLPTSDMYCGVEDERGFIWFATRNILTRYDGAKFEVMKNLAVSIGVLEIEKILTVDKKHLLLTIKNPAKTNGPRRFLLFNTFTFETRSLNSYFKNMPFADSAIVAVYHTKDKQLGFFTALPGTVYKYSPDQAFKQQYKSNTQLKKWKYATYTIDKVYEGKDFLFIGYQSYKSIIVTESNFFELPNRYYGLLQEKEKEAEVFFFDTLQWRIKSAFAFKADGKLYPVQFKNLDWNSVIPGEIVVCDNSKATMVSFKDGRCVLYTEAGQEIDVFATLGTGENAPSIKHFFLDRRGNYWVCTVKGVLQLRVVKNKFQTYFSQTDKFNYTNHSVRGMYFDKNWKCASLYNAFVTVKNGDTVVYPKTANFEILKTDTGFWVCSFVLRFFDTRNHKSYDVLGSPFSEIWSIYNLRKNTFLLGCTNNMAVYDIATKQLRAVKLKAGVPVPNFVYRFLRDKKNQLMAIADNGIYYLSDSAEIIDYFGPTAKDANKKLPISSIHDVWIDENDNYWIASGGQGLCFWNRAKSTFQFYDVSTNFPSNTLYCLKQDKFNNLWISSDFGLVRFNTETEFIRTYSTYDGVADNEFNRASQFTDEDGRFYFGGINGLTAFQPSDFEHDTLLNNEGFFITSALQYSKERKQNINLIDSIDVGKAVKITDDDNFLTITFAVLDYLQGQHQYAYRLEGVEDVWNYTNETTLRLTNLPYGTYRLVLRARAANGNWLAHTIEMAIVVTPPYYKTVWFQLGVFIGSILVIIVIFYYFFKQRVLRLQALSDLRMRIASSLHDEVGGMLNKTAMQAELALKNKSAQNDSLLQKIAENSRSAISNMRDVMWNLDSRNDFAYSLVDRMKEYALQMFEDNFQYSIDSRAVENYPINPELRQTLFLIYKEAVNNILKHAQGSKVEITIELSKSTLQLIIYSSAAMVVKESASGQGLRNMRWRAEKRAGNLIVDTSQGVRIIAVFPLN